MFRSSPSAVRISWKCLSASAQAVSATCSSKARNPRLALFSSMKSTRSAAIVGTASAAVTMSASKRSMPCSSRWMASTRRKASSSSPRGIALSELEEARDKVRWGKERRSLALSEKEKQNTAYHEAGHALLLELLPHTEPLHKVTIIPRGPSLGSTMWLPEEDKYTNRKNE